MNIWLYIAGLLGALIPFYISVKLKQGPIRGSALPSFLVAITWFILNNYFSYNLPEVYPIVFFGASFVGMVSPDVIKHIGWVGISGLLFSFIFQITGVSFEGFGGALGTTAGISSMIVIGIHQITNQLNKRLMK